MTQLTANSAGRTPRFIQGLVLVALAWVAAAASVALAPVLPTIAQVFKAVPGVDVKIPLVATGPALMVAVLSIPYGYLADKIGRRRLLLSTLGLYGAAGLAPLLLKSLDAIIVSRMAVGLAEAAIMTCGTALIGDYFQDRSRERWLAAQTGTATLAGAAMALLGGVLGSALGWRGPFLIYAWGWILVPLVLIFLWEPRRDRADAEASALPPVDLRGFSWGKPLWIAVVSVLSMMGFMLTVIQFSFLVTERGMTAPAQIGVWSALMTFGSPIGSVLFGLYKARTSTKLVTGYLLMALGFAIMALQPTVGGAIVGALIANIGSGMVLPTVLTWLMSTMPPTLRGRGAGLWTSASFLGQFLGPLAILALVKGTGNLSNAILSAGVACLLGALATAPSMVRGLRSAAMRSSPG